MIASSPTVTATPPESWTVRIDWSVAVVVAIEKALVELGSPVRGVAPPEMAAPTAPNTSAATRRGTRVVSPSSTRSSNPRATPLRQSP